MNRIVWGCIGETVAKDLLSPLRTVESRLHGLSTAPPRHYGTKRVKMREA
jgi:hypothetical protein